MARSMYASSFHIGKKTLSLEKGAVRSVGITARVAAAPMCRSSADMVASMDDRASTEGAPRQGHTMLSSALPPPVPEQHQLFDAAPPAEQPKRAGQLTPGWRMVFGIG